VRSKALIFTMAAIVAVLGAAPPASVSTPAPVFPAGSTARHADSYGLQPWTGFVDEAHANVKLRYVATNFVVPRVTCTSPISKASFWDGLDGYGNPTVEQVGLSTNCFNGQPTYLTFWEMFPNGPNYMYYVNPGDSLFIAVYYDSSANDYSLQMTDNTSGVSFNKIETCPSGYTCANADAEVILEAAGGTNLSQFTSVQFTGSTVTTRNGTHGGFTNAYYWDLHGPVMKNASGQELAQLSPPNTTGTTSTFWMTYLRSS
jgi:peptidase A4-like protein